MYSPAYGKTHRVTILCVDDDEMALLVRKMVLESAGYVVFTAASSSQGLEIFKEHHADLVITDHCLDLGKTRDLAGELRKLSPTVPIMTLSGSTQRSERLQPPDYYLHKLEGPNKMIAKVRSVVGTNGTN
jgi:two-component system response regulator CpxR